MAVEEIPTNDEGMFEAVTADGVVMGHGIVSDEGVVDFAYTDGVQEARTVLPVEKFLQVWTTFRVDRSLELRAAG